MKKILSLILAAMLVVGMVPAAFASDTAAGATSVTYNFTQDDRGGAKNPERLENKAGTWKYTEPKPELPGKNWRYLGTTVGIAQGPSVYVTITDEYVLTSSDAKQGEWIAFGIKVPKTAKYKMTEGTAYHFGSATRDLEMYIVEMTDELSQKFVYSAAGGIYGKVSLEDGATFYTRTGQTLFADLGISATMIGSANIDVSSADKGVKPMTLSDTNEVYLDSAKEYILIFNQGSETDGAISPSSITLTEQASEPEVAFGAESYTTDEDSTVQLTSTLTLDGADITNTASVVYASDNESVATVDNSGVVTGVKAGIANVTVTYTYGGKTYSATVAVTVTDIVKDKTYDLSSDNENIDWSWGGLLNDSAVIKDGAYLQLIPRKNYYNNESADYSRAAVKINVAHRGTYDISARIKTAVAGTEADVYMIPASVAVDEITLSYLKSKAIIGRLSGVGDGSNKTQFIGTATLSVGEYYVVFNFNTDNINTNNQNKQVLNLINLQLNESAGATSEVPASATAKDPNFMAAANISDASVTVTGAGEGPLYSVARGTTVKLTASPVEGYNFVGWMRGACKDNGEFSKFVDLTKNADGTYSYEVWTNTYLTAVYEPAGDSDTQVVKFWNYDGSYLGEKPVSNLDANNLPKASLIGHSFDAWWVAENEELDITKLTAAVTNAVAQYTANTTRKTDTANKKYDEVSVNGVVQSNAVYGIAIPCYDKDATHWLRDGKVVAYGNTYTHYVWDGTNIYSSHVDVTKKPLIVLESTTVDGAYMIEYEAPAGYTIAEVGILFAASGTPDVNSASERFSSQRGTKRGQFAAAPSDESYTVARGYMIYTESATGNAYVIYSK